MVKFISKVWPLFIGVVIVVGMLFYSSQANVNLALNTASSAAKKHGPARYIRVAVNDQPTYTPSQKIDGEYLVPARAICDAVGGTLSWNQAEKTLTLTYKDQTIKAIVDQEEAELNKEKVSLDVAPRLVDGAALLPYSLIEGPLELKSSWNESQQTVNIFAANYKPDLAVEKTDKVQYVPILMYHELGDGPNSLYVRDNEFIEQMKYLKEHNYRVLTLSEAVRKMYNKETMEKTVVITFDDAYVSFYTKAWPVLKAHHFPATVFVITENSQDPWYLNWEQARFLYAGWMEIGSHTMHHPWLANQSRPVYTDEIYGSKKSIEDQIMVPCEAFCYPGGNLNQAVADTVKEAGYLTAVTTRQGQASINSDQYQLPRIRVPRGMSLNAFARNIN